MRWPSDKKGARPAGNRRAPQKNIAEVNGDNPEHSPDHHPPQGLIPVGPVAAEIVADLRFRRQVGELLAELGAERSITTIIDTKLDTYVEIEPEALEATGGNRFWPLPLRDV